MLLIGIEQNFHVKIFHNLAIGKAYDRI